MTITCKLGDIRTNAAIWALIGKDPGDAVCTLLEPESFANAYRLDDYYNKKYRFPNDNAVLAQYELDHLYYKARVLEYDFRIIVPVLNGYFRIACERKDERKEQLFPANLLHYYSDGSDTPDVLSRASSTIWQHISWQRTAQSIPTKLNVRLKFPKHLRR